MRSTETRLIHSIVRITRAIAIAFNMTVITVLAMTTPAQAAIVHVNHASTAQNPDGESWGTAFPFLSDGLAAADPQADPPDEVWVAAGTYWPDESLANPNGTGNRATAFKLKKDVAVYGGFDGTETSRDQRDPENIDSILSGDLDQNDVYTTAGFLADPPDYSSMTNNSIHVLTALSFPASGQQDAILIDSDTILDGFIVSGGNANGANNDQGVRGAGLFCGGGSPQTGAPIHSTQIASSPTISRSRFEFNHAGGDGGGYAAAIYSSYGDPVLRDLCTFADNHAKTCAGATVIESGGDFTVLACTYQDNITGRAGGAHQSKSSQNTIIHSCKFINNKSTSTDVGQEGNGGAIMLINASSELVNCEFRGNSAIKWGGAARVRNAEVINCTIYDNTQTMETDPPGGGGIWIDINGTVTLKNTILYGNHGNLGEEETDALLEQISGYEPFTATYCDIQTEDGEPYECEGCSNNIEDDPEFKSASNLHLNNCSHCIDKGQDSDMPADSHNIDNDTSSTEPTPDADLHERILDGNGDTDANEIDIGAFEFDLGCPADLAGDGDVVNGVDLAFLLGEWTGPGTYSSCPPVDAADLSGPDCRVNGADLAVLLGQWGACPVACEGEGLLGGGGEDEDDGAIDQLVAWFLAGDMAAIIQWLIEQGY